MAQNYKNYEARYNWCPGEKEKVLAPEIRIPHAGALGGSFILSDEAMVRLPGEKPRKWGELKAKLERKPPFPPPFTVEADSDGPWSCDPAEIVRWINEQENRVRELTGRISRRNRQIENLRSSLADIQKD